MDNIDLELLERLQTLTNDPSKKLSDKKRAELASRIDLRLIASLLSKYTGKQSIEDVQIFNILQVVEEKLGVSLNIAAPIAFGPKSVAYYNDLIQYGRTLKRLMSPNELLTFLERDLLLQTSYLMCRGPREDLYDPRFLLRLFISMVHRGTELKCLNFCTSGALQFVLSALSLRDTQLRALAYVTLQRFLSLCNDLSTENFQEQSLISYFLRIIKHGVKKPNQRRFLVETVNVILHPSNKMFKPLMASLVQRPDLNLQALSEFRKFFFSTSLMNFKTERRWILHVCAMSIHDPSDYGLLEKSSVIGSCLAVYTSPIADLFLRKKVLALLNSCLRHESCARDLFISHNLSTWLAMVAHHPVTTAEDLYRIRVLHERLSAHIKDWLKRVPNPLFKAMLRANAKYIGEQDVSSSTSRCINNGADESVQEADAMEM